ncbi:MULTISPECIES: hypothetical protein [Streptomyces]|nr:MULTISPECIES: hypothetical protein [Streptomyces]
MTDTPVLVLAAGHLPVIGEWIALPVCHGVAETPALDRQGAA